MSRGASAPLPTTLFATAARGTEGALRDELRELGFRGVRADRGGVHFGGNLREGLRACLELRTAIRVLWELARFDAPDGDALYEGVRSVDWTEFLSPRLTLAVRASCRDSRLGHTQFVAQRAKDAVVDQLRDALGARPSVDLEDPDVGLFLHIVRDKATLYLDVSGASLHRRGYRLHGQAAPLKENLAAALVRLSGWDRESDLIDPMCGSGTIALEAALWARGIAPGLGRERFGVERWACHDQTALRAAAELRAGIRARPWRDAPPIFARDNDPGALAAARKNAAAAGVRIVIEPGLVAELAPLHDRGSVVTNPPYGDRVYAASGLYGDMARAFAGMRGHRVSIIAGTPEILEPIRLRAAGYVDVYNGDIPCRFITYVVP